MVYVVHCVDEVSIDFIILFLFCTVGYSLDVLGLSNLKLDLHHLDHFHYEWSFSMNKARLDASLIFNEQT